MFHFQYIKVYLTISVMLIFVGCTLLSTRSLNNADFTTTSLNLNKQRLGLIPAQVFELENLEVLRMYRNELTEITADIARLGNLEKLYLGKNKLKTLPEEIGQLSQLRVLSIPYNDLEYLPASMKNLKKLEHLVLDQNNLKSLPDFLGELPNLKTLTVSFNQLDTIQPALFKSGSFQILDFSQNLIPSFPEELGNCVNLHELHVSRAGFLTALPESLCNLRRMDVLTIDYTTQIPRCLLVRSSPSLRVFYK